MEMEIIFIYVARLSFVFLAGLFLIQSTFQTGGQVNKIKFTNEILEKYHKLSLIINDLR